MSKMKLLNSLQLATHFYSNGVSIVFFVSIVRRHELAYTYGWLNQNPIWKKVDNNNDISDGVSVLLDIYWLKEKPTIESIC